MQCQKNKLPPARWYLIQWGCRGSSTQWTAGELRGRCPANTGLYGYTTAAIASSCSAGFWSTPECTEGVRFKWEASLCLSHNTEITRRQKIPRGKTQNRAELGRELSCYQQEVKSDTGAAFPRATGQLYKEGWKTSNTQIKIPVVKSIGVTWKLQNSLNSIKRWRT